MMVNVRGIIPIYGRKFQVSEILLITIYPWNGGDFDVEIMYGSVIGVMGQKGSELLHKFQRIRCG